jgi:MSHA biogenesis protein MshQ
MGNNGSVDLTLNLTSASGSTCISATASSATSASIPWFGSNPVSKATFGIYKTPIIYMRENF